MDWVFRRCFLVYRYLDRSGVAEGARRSRDCKRVRSSEGAWRRDGERDRLGHASVGRGNGRRSGDGNGAGAHRERRAAGSRSDSYASRHVSCPVVAGKQYLSTASESWPAQRHCAHGGLCAAGHTRGIQRLRGERCRGLRHDGE